jgi:hypothetical protein
MHIVLTKLQLHCFFLLKSWCFVLDLETHSRNHSFLRRNCAILNIWLCVIPKTWLSYGLNLIPESDRLLCYRLQPIIPDRRLYNSSVHYSRFGTTFGTALPWSVAAS